MPRYRVMVYRSVVVRETAIVHVISSSEHYAGEAAVRQIKSHGAVGWVRDASPAEEYVVEHIKEITP